MADRETTLERIIDRVLDKEEFQRTEWQDKDTKPTVPGTYECSTFSEGPDDGHIYKRTFDGKNWLSQVTNEPSSVVQPWRGVVPGTVDLVWYSAIQRSFIYQPIKHKE